MFSIYEKTDFNKWMISNKQKYHNLLWENKYPIILKLIYLMQITLYYLFKAFYCILFMI